MMEPGASVPPGTSGGSDVDRRVAREGSVTYLHIPSTDPHTSATFYRIVFGWNVTERADRTSFEDGTGHVIGAWVTDRAVTPDGGVVPYVYVPSVRATLQQAVANGASVVRDPYPEGRLTVATISDPSGNLVGIWQGG